MNLFLEVLGKRADGFHEIETLMYPIDLFDSLVFRDAPHDQVRLTCQTVTSQAFRGQSSAATALAEQLPIGGDNLVVRAVELVRRRSNVTRGADVRLVKRIPLAAGLAGGSSDAAAALFAANRVWRLGLTLNELASLAAELGSDIPFFLYGGPAVCRGRGEIIEPVAGLGALHFVVAK
ncbi:MAG TPA: 4-(cytidine 5'-diphospho)-2-C-methyl-D-erythritol kinase, partial [Pirellulales bacterium]|nr:4-(cytidine 5'-diphospho)-2-C-methyl-D-erythritol kinase [Pirellulales bacterium]